MLFLPKIVRWAERPRNQRCDEALKNRFSPQVTFGSHPTSVREKRRASFVSRSWRRFCRWGAEVRLGATFWREADEVTEKCRKVAPIRQRNSPEMKRDGMFLACDNTTNETQQHPVPHNGSIRASTTMKKTIEMYDRE